jgi:hypothetical protein
MATPHSSRLSALNTIEVALELAILWVLTYTFITLGG